MPLPPSLTVVAVYGHVADVAVVSSYSPVRWRWTWWTV